MHPRKGPILGQRPACAVDLPSSSVSLYLARPRVGDEEAQRRGEPAEGQEGEGGVPHGTPQGKSSRPDRPLVCVFFVLSIHTENPKEGGRVDKRIRPKALKEAPASTERESACISNLIAPSCQMKRLPHS